MSKKEFFYVGYYFDVDNKFILKIGTTNDLERRKKEHNRNYHKATEHRLPPDREFLYVWSIPLSKYTTLRIEDRTRQQLKNEGVGKYIRNDRFEYDTPPDEIFVKIKKLYKVPIV